MRKIIYCFLIITTIYTWECYADLGKNQVSISREVAEYASPSTRFIQHHSMQNITPVLNKYGATNANKSMFEEMIHNEVAGFIGYHAASNEFRIFQDVLRVAIEEYLGIPIRADFQFLRVPGSSELSIESAAEFEAKYPRYDDQERHIQKYLISLNIALYYHWNFESDFTPRFFLTNFSFNKPLFEEKLVPFFQRLGMGRAEIDKIFALARKHVPNNKGVILQFFDLSEVPYAFANVHAYEGNRYIKVRSSQDLSAYYLFSDPDSRTHTNKYWIPKLGKPDSEHYSLRLFLSNKHTLNPNSPLVILRYHNMDPAKEVEYESQLRDYMRSLPFSQKLAEKLRDHLLDLWTLSE